MEHHASAAAYVPSFMLNAAKRGETNNNNINNSGVIHHGIAVAEGLQPPPPVSLPSAACPLRSTDAISLLPSADIRFVFSSLTWNVDLLLILLSHAPDPLEWTEAHAAANNTNTNNNNSSAVADKNTKSADAVERDRSKLASRRPPPLFGNSHDEGNTTTTTTTTINNNTNNGSTSPETSPPLTWCHLLFKLPEDKSTQCGGSSNKANFPSLQELEDGTAKENYQASNGNNTGRRGRHMAGTTANSSPACSPLISAVPHTALVATNNNNNNNFSYSHFYVDPEYFPTLQEVQQWLESGSLRRRYDRLRLNRSFCFTPTGSGSAANFPDVFSNYLSSEAGSSRALTPAPEGSGSGWHAADHKHSNKIKRAMPSTAPTAMLSPGPSTPTMSGNNNNNNVLSASRFSQVVGGVSQHHRKKGTSASVKRSTTQRASLSRMAASSTPAGHADTDASNNNSNSTEAEGETETANAVAAAISRSPSTSTTRSLKKERSRGKGSLSATGGVGGGKNGRVKRKGNRVVRLYVPSITEGPRAHLLFSAPDVEAEKVYDEFLRIYEEQLHARSENNNNKVPLKRGRPRVSSPIYGGGPMPPVAAEGMKVNSDMMAAEASLFRPWSRYEKEELVKNVHAEHSSNSRGDSHGSHDQGTPKIGFDALSSITAPPPAVLLDDEDDARDRDEDHDNGAAEVEEWLYHSSRFSRRMRAGQGSNYYYYGSSGHNNGIPRVVSAPAFVNEKPSLSSFRRQQSSSTANSKEQSLNFSDEGLMEAAGTVPLSSATRASNPKEGKHSSGGKNHQNDTTGATTTTNNNKNHINSAPLVAPNAGRKSSPHLFFQKFYRAFLVVIVAQVRLRQKRESGDTYQSARSLGKVEAFALQFVRRHMEAFKFLVKKYIMRNEEEVTRRSAQGIFSSCLDDDKNDEPTTVTWGDRLFDQTRLHSVLSPANVASLQHNNSSMDDYTDVEPLQSGQLFLSGKDAAWQPLLLDTMGVSRVLQCYAESSHPSASPSVGGLLAPAAAATPHHHTVLGSLKRFLSSSMEPSGGGSSCSPDAQRGDDESAEFYEYLRPLVEADEDSSHPSLTTGAWLTPVRPAGLLDPIRWIPYAVLSEAMHGDDADDNRSHYTYMQLDVAMLPISGSIVYRWVIPAEDTARFNLSIFFQSSLFSFLQGGAIPPPTTEQGLMVELQLQQERHNSQTQSSGTQRRGVGRNTLVHCSAGMHRSCGMVIAFLLWLLYQCERVEKWMASSLAPLSAGNACTVRRRALQACAEEQQRNPAMQDANKKNNSGGAYGVCQDLVRLCTEHVKGQRSMAEPIPTVAFLLTHFAAELELGDM